MKCKTTVTLLILLFSVSNILAQKDSKRLNFLDGLVRPVKFGKAFISEIHSTNITAKIGIHKEYNEYDLQKAANNGDNRPFVELHLGAEIPLFSLPFANNRWEFAVTLPMSIHVLEDMWEPITAPVIDTDYKFGSPRISFIHYMPANKIIKNYSFNWLPIFHECTHIGDEIVIYRKEQKLPLTRANISYEFTEFQAVINDPNGYRGNLHSLKVGGKYRISNRGKGYFDIRENSEATIELNEIPNSTKRFEYYLNYQFQRATGIIASSQILNILAIELRSKMRYGFPLFEKDTDGAWIQNDIKETRKMSININFGWEFYAKEKNTRPVGLYINYYQGINPFGQLRNQPIYRFLGIALNYSIN